VSQNASLTFTGVTYGYTDIWNYGLITQSTDSSLTMFDSNIHNTIDGTWRFDADRTFLGSSSITFTDPALIPSWFYNLGVVESTGRPTINIKFNNTLGTMIAHIDSTNNIPQILGDYTFTTPEVIFKQSTFIAVDSVLIFNYSSFYAPGTPQDPRGSFGLPFVPIISLAVPFDPSVNGYFDPNPNYANGRPDSVYVQYKYNNGNNQVPDILEGDGTPIRYCVGCPRIIMYNTSDTIFAEEGVFSTQLTLVASANFDYASFLLLLILAVVAFFSVN